VNASVPPDTKWKAGIGREAKVETAVRSKYAVRVNARYKV